MSVPKDGRFWKNKARHHADCVTAEGDTIATYYVLKYPDWVHVIAITPEQKIVLIDQYRHSLDVVSLEVPAGSIDQSNGSLLAAAARELAEETGYVADEYRIVAKLSPNPTTHSNMIHVVLALNARASARPQNDPSEKVEISLVSVRDLLTGIFLGEMVQALHVSSVSLGLEATGLLSVTAE
jgi:8-oxo-dGTP pyrophosphatase MutT (NUDIX family)